jgi:hypothetical protein
MRSLATRSLARRPHGTGVQIATFLVLRSLTQLFLVLCTRYRFVCIACLLDSNPPRVHRLAAARRCIRLDISKANRGCKCRTVCRCDLQTRLASCTSGHLCYDENVGSCRLVLVRRAVSRLLVPGVDVWIGHLTVWSGRLHVVRHPGQSDGHCERIDKTLSLLRCV